MIIDILPFRLQLASLQKSDIPRCTHQLMKLVLFPAGPRHFFSYTETDKEVSLILDESHVADFPKDALNVCNVIWRAVQIEPGESGLGTEDVVSQVSRPLADINVSIMQISTYDADFTLMPECDLKRALECLSSKFSISNNPLEDVGLQVSDLKTWDNAYPLSPTEVNSLQDALLLDSAVRERQASIDGEPQRLLDGMTGDEPATAMASLSLEDPHSKLRPAEQTKARHPFNADYPHRLHITSMEQSLMDMLAIRLLQSIFFDTRLDRFFSFTQTDTTLSLIMDDATVALFPDHTLNTHAGDWRLIAIGDGPLGFDECGIVSEFSRPLNDNNISLFYLSTFNSDYIMVNDHDFDQAVACLHATANVPVQEPAPAAETVVSTQGELDTSHAVHDEGLHKEIVADDYETHSQHSEWDSGSEHDSSSEVDPEEILPKHEDDVEVVFADDSPPT
ncbi:GATS protein-like 3 [Mortierella alpina]|uniref:GATS protein-like 3 n=1 Tax=Mortierella alpina TaxID=64518 RepID=A0A9P6JD70_MORAP|nr:GATS protein-like 3 [Mortierella alpina]